ncbi:expressed protein [Aureococcus anophagefferens]|uniref:Expressed protein n=1 Tax=Aureococcus anophagefferens TaxID=44056 RepID=F0YA46_AURAN|nr:expressed protein [Aureococcus anophagefferens]EGB07869.1 expressed protein [Aureococcus anophagefferens]|eukprot:XP_009037246.1 expressed protein [Aureococcus anophagefferens]
MHGRVVLALVACAAGSFEHLHILPDNDALTELWFIGDLHGDVGCARQWVARSGLVAFDAAGPRWTGRAGSALVFLGDYVDKGVHSSDVLALVRSLVEAFPDRVAAIMGNHDLFLYLDATLDGSDPRRPMRMSVQAYPYSFFHPEEYAASPFTTKRDDDGEVLDALLESLLFVYETRATRKVLVPTPSAPAPAGRGRVSLFDVAPRFRDDGALAAKVAGRLDEWRVDYAAGLRDSGLVDFLRARPVVAIVGDALVVHGGLPPEYATDALPALVAELRATPWANLSTAAMRLAAEATQDRSFHREGGCAAAAAVLAATGAARIVVGHTPGDDVRELCGGAVLAADSSLSRPFRANGNYYCAVANHKPGGSCDTPEARCEGSVATLTRASADDPWPRHALRVAIDGGRTRAADDDDAPADGPGRARGLATAAAVGGLASWWLGAGREKPRHRASDDPSDDGPVAEEPAAPDAPPEDGDATT